MGYSSGQISIGLSILSLILVMGAWIYAWQIKKDAGKNSVATEDIQDLAVTTSKLAGYSVTMGKIDTRYFFNDNMRYFSEFWQKAVAPLTTMTLITASTANAALRIDTTPATAYFGDTENLAQQVNLNFYLQDGVTGTSELANDKCGMVSNKGLLLKTRNGSAASGDMVVMVSSSHWARTDSQFDFTTIICIPTIETSQYMIGLFGTRPDNTTIFGGSVADNQAYFYYGTEELTAFTGTTGKLCFVYSVADANYVTSLLTVVAGKDYKLRIACDSSRKLRIFVNDVQYSLPTTAFAAPATAAVVGTGAGIAMTDAIPFFASAIVKTLSTSSTSSEIPRTLQNRYMKCTNTWTPA
jgi:hypothetical protein